MPVVVLLPWHWRAAATWIILYALVGIGLTLALGAIRPEVAGQDAGKFEGEQGMGPSEDEIDRQIKEARDDIDENLGALEQGADSNAVRYGKIAAVIVGVAVVAGAGVLIYRRVNRRTRAERLRSMLVEALRDLPESLRDLPDEVSTRLKRSLPTIKVVVNGEEAEEPGTLERIVRRVAPAVVGGASTAVIERLTRSSRPEDAGSRSTVHSND